MRMLAAVQAHAMHAQAKPAGRKLKYQESQGASGHADDVASEQVNPEHAANPSVAGHEGTGHHGSAIDHSSGGSEPRGEPAYAAGRSPDLAAAAGPAE